MVFDEDWSTSPLTWLDETMGAQLVRASGDPGLLAAVDQHAAAVRDAITLDREALGDYLLGFLDELRETGWTYAGDGDFAEIRLTAICWLARESGFLTDELPA
ncbi:DUF6401 family natural product biosynthesis protein [Planotetraspora sp. GP83]|uniref:DUF6401 family natural product biosynthesis protein n=1 Tax=Planotetraspora sp. GP83 TaxID=3156264 RepID=UPI0035151D3C